MVLATHCPYCSTSFRVVPDQIKLRGGWVRCGVCNEAFDSTEYLFELDPAGGPPRPVSLQAAPDSDPSAEPRVVRKRGDGLSPAAVPGVPATPGVPEDESSSDRISPAGGMAQPGYPASSQPGVSAPASDEIPVVLRPRRSSAAGEAAPRAPEALPDATDAVEDSAGDALVVGEADDDPIPRIVAEPRSAYAPPADEPDFFDQDEKRRRRRAQWLWGIAALVALVVLAGQALWMFRAEFATRVPAARPLLEKLCQRFHCTVGYPRAPELLVIESSSIEPWSPDSPGFAPPISDPLLDAGQVPAQVVLPVRRLALRILLRNRAAFPQAWPAIELSLMDLSDAVAARRVLLPSVYLSPQDLAKPLGPLEERTLRIPVETIDAHATGYRVALFYP